MPDIGLPSELLVAISVATLEILRRLRKNGRARLVLTLEDTDEPSKKSLQSTKTSEADGRKTDSNAHKKPPTEKQRGD